MPVIVWIDRTHARLYRYDRIPPFEQNLPLQAPASHSIFERLIGLLEDADRVLIVGPGVSRYRLSAYIRETAPQIARKIVGCEELEQPEEFQLRALAEKHLDVVSNPSRV
jgi:hypothetical protein